MKPAAATLTLAVVFGATGIAQDRDREHRRPVAAVVRSEVEPADIALVGDRQQPVIELPRTAARAAAGEAGGEGRPRRIDAGPGHSGLVRPGVRAGARSVAAHGRSVAPGFVASR